MPSPTSGNPTFSVISSSLASDVAAAGTFTASYPSGKDKGNFFLATGHKLVMGQNVLYYPVDFDVTLTTLITITNKTSAAWAQGTAFRLQMNEQGERSQVSTPTQDPNAITGVVGSTSSYAITARAKLLASTTSGFIDLVNLGAPTVKAANNICTSQSLASSGALTINGSLASGGVATLDVPRAIRIVSSGSDTAVITFTGTDVYGQTLKESITLNGTTVVNGKKAFKTVTAASASAAIANLLTVGTTDILGIPVFLPSAANIVGEIRNGVPTSPGGATIAFSISQTDTLAGTAQNYVSPIAGSVRGLSVIVQGGTVATGGPVTVNVGTTPVTGLSVTVADAVPAGTAYTSSAVVTDGTDVVARGGQIQVVPGGSFATSGAINGSVYIAGLEGAAVAGVVSAGGATATSGDIRGTYTPAAACDGTPVQLLLFLADRTIGANVQYTG